MKCRQLLLICLLSKSIVFGTAFAQPIVQVSAVNSRGDQIDDFEAMLAVGRTRHTQWYKSKNGTVTFKPYDLESRMGGEKEYVAAAEVFVRSSDYATESQSFKLGENENRQTLTLEEGRRLTIEFADDGNREIPNDLDPFLLPFEYRDAGCFRWQQPEDSQFRHYDAENWYLLKRVDSGRYEVRVTNRTPRLYLHIDDYDFLRCYESGPYDLAKLTGDAVEIVLPSPTSVTANFRIPEETVVDGVPMRALQYSVSRPKNRDGGVSFPVFFDPLEELDSELIIADLSPGQLYVGVTTTSRKDVEYGETDPGVFRDRQLLEIQSGQPQSITFEYRKFSERPFSGERNVVLKVMDRSGKAVGDKNFRVEYFDKNFGAFVVASGEIEFGEIELTNVVATADVKEFPERYVLHVNERMIGQFAVNSDVEQQVETFVLAPDVGDTAPSFTVTNLEGAPVTVDFGDRVTLLEFWATWCGPCQLPMDKLNQVAQERASGWGNKVQLIALSIDDDANEVRRHIESRNWLDVNVLIDTTAKSESKMSSAFSSMTASDYLVNGVPTAILIDADGKIVYRGHPSSLDLIARVEELLENAK